MTNAAIPALYVPPRSHARSQREREVTPKTAPGEKGRATKKFPRYLLASSAPKISEILEHLAFLKGSRISEILRASREPAGSIFEVSRKG